MNIFEKLIYSLQRTMPEPESFGWFHLLWISISFITIFILYKFKNKHNEKQLKWVIGIYGIIAFLLELAKQISQIHGIHHT